MNRRSFVKSAGVGLAGLAVFPGMPAAARRSRASGLKRAVKYGMIDEPIPMVDKFRLLKELGFDGVEMDSPNAFDTAEVIAARDGAGLPIHGVVDSVHWQKTLGDPDPAVRAEGVAGLETALRDANAYGASTVLLVPAVVNENISYADAYSRSQAEVRKVLPLASELGVKVAFENVWNRFLLSPLEFARYIDEFESEMVGAYFDVGNIVNYGWPEHWIRTLGPRILKLDIKEYSRSKRDKEGPYAGFQVELGEGDNNWPAVMEAIREIGYQGWATAEIPGGGRERLADIAARMNRILEIG